jgi:type IV pilus assembly protein PilQ
MEEKKSRISFKRRIMNRYILTSRTIGNGKSDSMKSNIKSKFLGLLTLLILISSPLMAQVSIENIEYNSKSNGDVKFIFTLDNSIEKPEVFMTNNPARLAFDLANVVNSSGVKLIQVGTGNTKSLRVVSTNEKSRAVIDLFKNAHHSIKVEGNNLIIEIQGSRQLTTGTSTVSTYHNVENIDFRRGKNGEGRVILTFNKPGAIVNLRETADKIKLEISSTDLPENLDNKLDVVDFATPITYIDTRQKGDMVKIDIEATGVYEHTAYQTGNQYVIEVKDIQAEIETNAQQLDEEVEYSGNKVSFNFQDIPVRSVLQLIADASQLNLVVADTVEGSVTLRLNNVPWDQDLDIVLNSKQLDKRRKDDVIWIAPASEIADREQQKLESLQQKEQLEPLKTIFIQVNYAKAGELATLLGSGEGEQSLLSSRGSVTFDERTNILLVSDVPTRLVVIEELIKSLDVAVKQVQIESRIVIATDKFGDELGVRFGVNGSHEDNYGNIISTGGSLLGLDRMNSNAVANRINSPNGSGLPTFTPGSTLGNPMMGPTLGERLNVNLPSGSNAGTWAFSILAADYLLDLELSALESEGRGEIVSTPRIVTTNQKEATIRQGVELPYQNASSSGATTVQYKSAVLSLKVTPLITPDDRVDLTLEIKNDSVGELFPTGSGGFIPSIDTRAVQSRVLVESGQTIVLGGIYEQVKRTDKTKVPLLGDIPGIGALFRNKIIQDDKAELLIFVTPTIIKENF